MMEYLDEHWKIVDNLEGALSDTPPLLWAGAKSYFRWCDENPIRRKRVLTSGKEAGKPITEELTRPYSLKGLCLHCNISERYIESILQTNAKNSEFYIVVEKIMYVIYTQNLEGAVVDMYNPIIISKLLNMDTKKDDTNTPVKVEIVDSRSGSLANSENEVLKKLDFGKVEILKDKLENS